MSDQMTQGNPLSPMASPMAQDPTQMLTKAHDTVKGLFQKTGQAMAHLETMQEALGQLAKLGDMVTPEDVIKTAGDLVGAGTHSAQEMAVALSSMPPSGGQAIAAWVNEHIQRNAQQGKQLAQMHALARHETAVSGMRLLKHLGDSGRPEPTAAGSPAVPGMMGVAGNG